MTPKSSSQSHVVSFRITNSEDAPVTLYLEPWGEDYAMAPGCVFEIELCGPDKGRAEIEYGKGFIAVYGWPGATAKVLQGDQDVEPSEARN